MDNQKFNPEDNQKGMEQKHNVPNDEMQQTNRSADSQEQGRASFQAGSTTQGGSNFGQGSSQLGGESYQQGDAKNDGTNYENEAGKFATTHKKQVPPGQGLRPNETEANAKEEYPGPLNEEASEDLDKHTHSMD